MPLSEAFWGMAEHLMDVIRAETGFPMVICDGNGTIVRATEPDRIGDQHAGARKIIEGLVDAYAVTPEEACRDPRLREGYSCPIVIEGRRVATFGLTGPLAQTKPLARIAARLLDAWIQDTQHQDQLRRSEQKYRSIFDNSIQGIFQSTLDGRLLTANKALAELYGYESADDLLAEFTHAVDKLYLDPADRRQFLHALQERGRAALVTRSRRKDGSIIDVSISGHLVPEPGGTGPIIEGFIEDITARKMAEEALRVSEDKYFKTFDNSPNWVVLSSLATGRYIEVNKTFLRTMGYAREDIIGRSSLDIDSWVTPEDRWRIHDALETKGAVRNVEVQRRTRDGRVLTMLFSAEVLEVAGEACILSVSQDISDRKRTEDKLRLSESNLRITLDSIGDAVIATDTAGLVRRMNPMAEALTGWSAAEACGRPLPEVFRIVNAYTRETVEDPAARVLATGELIGLANHTVLIARDGREYQIADSGAPIRNPDGRIAGVVLVFRDVSEAYEQQRKIREHEALLNHITTNIPGVVYQFYATPDHTYGFRYLSEKAAAIFGMDLPAASAFPALLERVAEAERGQLLASIKEAVDTASPWHYEGRFTKPTGEERWFSANAVPYRDGTILVYDGVLMDTTDFKIAQEEIQQRRQFLESVLYHAPDAIVTLDAAHHVIDWNPGAVRVFGYTPEEAFGRELDGLVAGDQAPEAGEKTGMVLSGRRVEAFETVRYRKDGSEVHVIAAGSPIMVGDCLRGAVAIYTDITRQKSIERERKGYEARIQQMQKMEAIGMLAGGIAHDFNNILSAVIGYAELALIDTAEEPRTQENIRQIHAAGIRARDLVKQILTFSRQGEKELKPLQVGVQIKEALKMLRSSLPSTIEMRSRIAPAVDNVLADPTHIYQIVMNLCTNAAQAMEERGGRLTVELAQVTLSAEDVRLHPDLDPGTYARIRIRDTGTGIPAEILDRIYDPYFTTKEKGKGTGLGLAVVHGIVKSYGGDIGVFETAPGKGTAFDIFLPTIKAPLETTAGKAILPRGTERILLVDDETAIVDFTRQSLERLGYRVDGFTRSGEALERFRNASGDYDLVITDMTMPCMTGDLLAAEISRLRQGVPIILCTGYNARIDALRTEVLGIRAVLMKPVSLEDLAGHIRRVLDGP